MTDAFLSKTMYSEILLVRDFIEEIIEHLVYKSSKYAMLHKYSLIIKCAFSPRKFVSKVIKSQKIQSC